MKTATLTKRFFMISVTCIVFGAILLGGGFEAIKQ